MHGKLGLYLIKLELVSDCSPIAKTSWTKKNSTLYIHIFYTLNSVTINMRFLQTKLGGEGGGVIFAELQCLEKGGEKLRS